MNNEQRPADLEREAEASERALAVEKQVYRNILQKVLMTNGESLFFARLFDGYSVTLDADTGELMYARFTDDDEATFARQQLARVTAERDAAVELLECVECGQKAFTISPLDPCDGFCWHCRKLLTIRVVLCECPIRYPGQAVCKGCHKPYNKDGSAFGGRYA